MKTMKRILSAGIFITVVATLFSCSSSVEIAKRRYSPGFYVHVSGKSNAPQTSRHGNRQAVIPAEATAEKAAPVIVSAPAEIAETKEQPSENTGRSVIAKTKIHKKAAVASLIKEEAAPVIEKENIQRRAENESLAGKKPAGTSANKVVLIILCFLIPWLAVGLTTDWDIRVLYNLLWTLLFIIPGIIHALIVVSKEG